MRFIKSFFIILLFLLLVGCSNGNDMDKDKVSFVATVLEIESDYLLVKPETDTAEHKSADKIEVTITKAELLNEQDDAITIEDITKESQVKIFYDGSIEESYPAQIHNCFKIIMLN